MRKYLTLNIYPNQTLLTILIDSYFPVFYAVFYIDHYPSICRSNTLAVIRYWTQYGNANTNGWVSVKPQHGWVSVKPQQNAAWYIRGKDVMENDNGEENRYRW